MSSKGLLQAPDFEPVLKMHFAQPFIILFAATVLASQVEVSTTVPDEYIHDEDDWEDEPILIPGKEDCNPDVVDSLLDDFEDAIIMATRARDLLNDANRPAHVTNLFNVLFRDNGNIADPQAVASEWS
jgi:hypothetical protein